MMRVAVPGAAGRMGRELVRAVTEAEDLTLWAATEAPGSPHLGQDAGTVAGIPPLGVTVGAGLPALLDGAQGVIDFTAPAVTAALVPLCAEAGIPVVVGTTGLTGPQERALREASARVPVVHAPNMSAGVNVLLALVADAARLLGPGFDLEVVEAHHRHKVDAPSGTALALARALALGRHGDGDTPAEPPPLRHGRAGQVGARGGQEIGLHAVRGGDVVGEHTVLFLGSGERLELTHRASSRQTFAWGAVRALRWARDRDPGLYTMQDVLGLRRSGP